MTAFSPERNTRYPACFYTIPITINALILSLKLRLRQYKHTHITFIPLMFPNIELFHNLSKVKTNTYKNTTITRSNNHNYQYHLCFLLPFLSFYVFNHLNLKIEIFRQIQLFLPNTKIFDMNLVYSLKKLGHRMTWLTVASDFYITINMY